MHSSEQRYMETLFPGGSELPANSLTPCLVEKGGRPDLLFLIKGEDEVLATLAGENGGTLLESELVVHWESGGEGREADLVLRLDLQYPGRTLVFEASISGTEPDKQAAIGRALLQVNRFGVFVAGNDFRFAAFQAFAWDNATIPKLRRILLEAAARC